MVLNGLAIFMSWVESQEIFMSSALDTWKPRKSIKAVSLENSRYVPQKLR